MDVTKVQSLVEQDETSISIPIFQKNGDPYLGRDGEQSTVDVLGSDSKAVRQAKAAVQRKFLHSRRQKMEPADVLTNRIAIAGAAITGWAGWENGDDDLAFTGANKQLLLQHEHILQQIEAGVEAHGDFFKAAQPS